MRKFLLTVLLLAIAAGAHATDTVRSQSYLQTRFANNSTGAIKAQDVRDFLVSADLKASVTKTASYTATANDRMIMLDGTSSAINLTLPAANANTATGAMYFIKAVSVANPVAIVAVNGNSISGAATYNFSMANEALIIGSDGSNWWILSKPPLGQTSTDCTPAAISVSGTASSLAKSDHTHRSPGAIYSATGETMIMSSNAENTITASTNIPVGFLTVGTTLRIKARGTIQFQSTSGTLTLRAYLGANAASQAIVVPTQTTGAGPFPFVYESIITVQAAGSGTSGKYIASSSLQIQSITAAQIITPNTNTNAVINATQTNLDTTIAETIKLTGQWATSSATNILKIEQAIIEVVKL